MSDFCTQIAAWGWPHGDCSVGNKNAPLPEQRRVQFIARVSEWLFAHHLAQDRGQDTAANAARRHTADDCAKIESRTGCGIAK